MSTQELLEGSDLAQEQQEMLEQENQNALENNDEIENQEVDENQDDDEQHDSETEHDDEEGEESDKDDAGYTKKHFRRLERKLKKENRNLRQQLQNVQSTLEAFVQPQMNQYSQPSGDETQDEVALKVNEVLKQREMQQQQMQQYEQMQKIDMEFKRSLEAAEEVYPDFEDVVRNENLPLTQAMVDVTKFLPNGADVLYRLGKNVDEARRISQLRGPEMFKALVEHSQKIGSSATKKVSSAPAPSALKAKASPGVSVPVEQMSYEQLKAHYKRKRQR